MNWWRRVDVFLIVFWMFAIALCIATWIVLAAAWESMK